MTFYPCFSPHSLVHVTELNNKKTLCGKLPPEHWEMSFQGEGFPEIGQFVHKHFASQTEGFEVGRSFAPDFYFCKICYKKLKIFKT